jgi:hypothetical protein
MSHVEDDGAAWRRWEPILKVAHQQSRTVVVTLRNGGPSFTGKVMDSVTGMKSIGSVIVSEVGDHYRRTGMVFNIDPREIAVIGTRASN